MPLVSGTRRECSAGAPPIERRPRWVLPPASDAASHRKAHLAIATTQRRRRRPPDAAGMPTAVATAVLVSFTGLNGTDVRGTV